MLLVLVILLLLVLVLVIGPLVPVFTQYAIRPNPEIPTTSPINSLRRTPTLRTFCKPKPAGENARHDPGLSPGGTAASGAFPAVFQPF
jgi:hypothetical protein